MTTGTKTKEYGFSFNASMVRAILDGRKSMTRRIPSHMNCIVDGKRVNKDIWSQFDIKNGTLTKDLITGEIDLLVRNKKTNIFHNIKPIYTAEDVIWGRETHSFRDWNSFLYMIKTGVIYASDHPKADSSARKWKPSIHMPRWASRITREITSVHFEFLHDINERDAVKEGCLLCLGKSTCGGCDKNCEAANPKKWFANLWDSIYGKTVFAWKHNYPVISIEFKYRR